MHGARSSPRETRYIRPTGEYGTDQLQFAKFARSVQLRLWRLMEE